MKNFIFIFFLIGTSFFSVAQSKGAGKISVELQKKIATTPVGFFKNGKAVVNQKVLNSKFHSGEKISSFKIVLHEDTKKYFLVRKAKFKKGFLTNFTRLKKQGDAFFATPYLGGNNDLDCFSNTCQSCAMAIVGSGTAVCECESTGGDCSEYDHSESSEVRLGSFFN